jgi:hypothetical protein
MSLRCSFCLGALASLLVGCPAPTVDPPPAPAKPEIPVAPPRALGARAGGTDAAPKPEGLPTSPSVPSFPLPGLGGTTPDAGPPVPDTGTPAPDAGMAL